MPESAIDMYERYTTTSSFLRLDTFVPNLSAPRAVPSADPAWLAGAHKRLGELYEAKGDTSKAVRQYLLLVDLWKNADPELQPKVAELRLRLARLRDTERQ